MRQRQRRQRSSLALALEDPREATNAFVAFVRRKAGSFLSLGIGIVVGLFIAGLLGGGHVRCCLLFASSTSSWSMHLPLLRRCSWTP